ncbi:MAG: response regulator transcription factor [Rubrobacter sp.]|nr:response regulator transcription factor [Rubrobacter sp.]
MVGRRRVGEAPLNRGVVIADGHPVTRVGLRELLDDAGVRVVGECGNGEEALRLAREAHPDLVILALDLASAMDGIRVCWDLKDLPEPPRVLVLTTRDLAGGVASGLLNSADGYLHKRTERQEFLETVRRVSSGERVWRLGERVVDPGNEVRLTPKEREILVLVVLGYTDTEMAHTLSIGSETVKTHTTNVLKKLGAKRRREVCKNPP